ncbi:hypothetical protein NDU88_005169 [Pleurodeles waltl]|uniref:Reverse transcriptase domain-containing protein n=1 Tax=Pleurodeles waltl TaxID=8319 RepID=A0AAV7M8I2_PLEWA|nr:hypothetical protein NDU88_005169 [Pleurodeles waltl]
MEVVSVLDLRGQTRPKPIELDEIQQALGQMAHNKAPGGSSLTAEYYQILQTLMPYLEMLQEAYERGRLPESQREAIIVVLHKKGRDPLDVRSYRPLSLLNSDCKLLIKVLANRLLPLMPTLVHPDQSGFIPGPSTFTNIRCLLRLIAETPELDQTQTAVSLDVEKAFDRLGWPHMGFGNAFM